MPLPPLLDLAVFMAAVMFIALFVLSAGGHFPAEHRASALRSLQGTALLWTTMTLTAVAAGLVLVGAVLRIPWYAAVIGGGAMLLLAPLALQRLPDRLVDGVAGLLLHCTAAMLLALLLLA